MDQNTVTIAMSREEAQRFLTNRLEVIAENSALAKIMCIGALLDEFYNVQNAFMASHKSPPLSEYAALVREIRGAMQDH